jgi:hypothetical protein
MMVSESPSAKHHPPLMKHHPPLTFLRGVSTFWQKDVLLIGETRVVVAMVAAIVAATGLQ